MTTHAKDTVLISKVIVTSLPSLFDRLQIVFYRSVRVSNKAIENLLLISSLYNEN